jgi:hypothetical protein
MTSIVTRKTHRSDRSRWIATTIRGAAVATRARFEKCQQATSFDHLVGAGDKGSRKIETKGFCRLQVNHQIIFGRSLDQKIGLLRHAATTEFGAGGPAEPASRRGTVPTTRPYYREPTALSLPQA